MFCLKCQKDLADCVCPDLKERLAAIGASPHILLGADYTEKIRKQAERNKVEGVRAE